MSDLVAFLRERQAEDEGGARMMMEREDGVTHPVSLWRGVPLAARVLREVEAKRKILERHGPHETAFDGLACNWCSEDVDDRPQLAKEPWPCGDVRALAAVYSDHSDYQQEWA